MDPTDPFQARDLGMASLSAPSSPAARARWWLIVLAVALIGGVWYMQRPGAADPAEERRAKAGLGVEAPGSDLNILFGKLLLAFSDDEQLRGLMRGQVDGAAVGSSDPADQVRLAMVLIGAGEPDAPAPQGGFSFGSMDKPLSISERLDNAAEDCDPESPLLDDIKVVRAALAASEAAAESKRDEAAAGVVAELSDEQKAGFRERHGWFAEVLLSVNDKDAPVRKRAETQVTAVIVVGVLLGGFILLAALAGTVLWIVGVIMLAQGKLRRHFVRPPPLGDEQPRWAEYVWLETVCVFAAGFLGLKFVDMALSHFGVGDETAGMVILCCQWLLVSAIFWPVARGLDWKTWRERIGWCGNGPDGSGVAKEIGFGMLGYLCALPVLFGTVIVAFIIGWMIEALTGKEPISPEQATKVQDLLGGGNVWVAILIFTLATIWAPIVEESLFRGALYRHLRRGWPVLVAGLVSALAFAVMHSYALLQLLLVGALGMVYALMREWRGSIIPSAVAHCIHNTVALTLMLALGPLMKP